MRLGGVVFALVATISGCTSWQSGVIRTAAFDHDCRDEDVHIIEVLEPGSGWAQTRAVRLDVCGDERLYRRTTSGWLDFTNAVQTSDELSPSASPRTSAEIRAMLRELNPGVMACTHDAPLSPHFMIDATGHLTDFTGMPDGAEERTCLGALFGRVHLAGAAAPMSLTPHFAPAAAAAPPTE